MSFFNPVYQYHYHQYYHQYSQPQSSDYQFSPQPQQTLNIHQPQSSDYQFSPQPQQTLHIHQPAVYYSSDYQYLPQPQQIPSIEPAAAVYYSSDYQYSPQPQQIPRPTVFYSSDGRMHAQFHDMTLVVDEDGEIIDDFSQFEDPERTNRNLIAREETILQHLKTRTHLQSKDSESDICVICQEEYQDGENIGKLGCGHEYHVDCIKEWLHQNDICPICKTNFSTRR